MADEPSLSELWRLIQDTRADLAGRLDQLVRRDVYDAREAARDRDMAGLRREFEDAARERERDTEKRASDRRLIFTALIAPILVLALTIYLASRGVHQ